MATSLLANNCITTDEFNTAFFKGFPHTIWDIIIEHFEKVYPHHPIHEPFPVQGILDVACHHFTSNHFHQQAKSQKRKAHDKYHSHTKYHYNSPDAFIQQMYGSTHFYKKKWCSYLDSDTDSDSNLDLDSDSDLVSSSDSNSDSKASSNSNPPKYKTKHVHFKHSCLAKS